MIRAEFYRNSANVLTGVRISGHAGMAEEGYDICCACVSSAVELTANTMTDVFMIKAEVRVEENEIIISPEKDGDADADKLLLGLLTHLTLLSEDFPGRIKITVTEV